MNLDKSVSIIGCGISGIFAALKLRDSGIKNIKLFDKSRGLGGRLATRRSNDGKFDHGIQYIKLDNISNLPQIKSLKDNNILKESVVSGLFIGNDGMTSIAKFLAKDLIISKEFKLISLSKEENSIIMDFENGETIRTDSIILSSPIKQSIEILEQSKITLNSKRLEEIMQLEYHPSLILMVESENSINLSSDFYHEYPNGNFNSITDNFRKGVSKKENFYTLLCSHDFSEKNFEENYEHINSLLKDELDTIFGKDYKIISNHKWRYSIPKNFYTYDDSINIGSDSFIGLCGDIFTNGKFDGAIKSGFSIAEKYLNNEI
jgi:predicted NAD/FAD-dependent oxidoreductase